MSKDADKNTKKDEKWDFDDWAFTITGIIVGVLLVAPDLISGLVYGFFGIEIFSGNLDGLDDTIIYSIEHGTWTLNELRYLSPMLFLLTITICMVKDAIVARKKGGYAGSMFTHTFESLLEDAIYMAITTIMVYSAVLMGAMYSSWLAGPITWVLFLVIFPLVRRKNKSEDYETDIPWLLLSVLIIGIIAEIITGMWIAFPLSWLIICVFKFIGTIRDKIESIDDVFDFLYYAFSVILMAVGIFFGNWITSWTAFPIALFICWIMSKTRRFKKTDDSD